MSLLCAASDVRITLGDLKNAFQLQVSPSYSDDVTLTSLSDSLQSVTTGSLYMPSFEECGKANVCDIVGSAEKRGAYAALLPASLKEEETSQSFGIPVLFGDLDIDKIMNMQSRKRVLSVNIKDVEIVAPMGDSQLHAFERMKALDYSTNNPQDKTYVMVASFKGETVKVLFNPNEKILKGMQYLAPRKVII